MNSDGFIAAQEKLFDAIAGGAGSTSVVPLRTEYVGAARGLGVLAFLPTSLADSVAADLQTVLGDLVKPHHRYEPASMHVTVKNIRTGRQMPTFGEPEIRAAVQTLGEIRRLSVPLDFELRGLLRFPSSIVIRAFSEPGFTDLVRLLDRSFRAAGLIDDKHYASNDLFVAPVTVCRFTSSPGEALLERVDAVRDRVFGRFRLDALHLVSCDEVCSPKSRTTHLVVPI